MSKHRQDLLAPFLTPRVYAGRFATRTTLTVAGMHPRYVSRWSENQQNVYAASLLATIQGEKRSIGDEGYALDVVSRMPAVAIGPIEALCGAGAENLAVRDKALMALGKVDGGRGARALVAALNDDRARIAIYALRRSLLEMPQEQAVALLRTAPLGKVTVAKEVLRLVGDVGGDKAYGYLQEAVAKSDLHPDVRIALLRAMWGFLDRDETWRSFEKAACDESLAVARAAIRVPGERLSNLRRQRLAGLLEQLLLRDAPLIRLETLRRLVEAPLKHEGASLCVTLAGFLSQSCLEEEAKLTAEALLLNTPSHDVAALAPILAACRT